MGKYRDRYRVESARRPGWDYAEPGMYFVTICTEGRKPWFGEIRNGIMGLSNIGCVVANEIQRTSIIRSNVMIDAWIVMPDHVHVIIKIDAMIAPDVVETHRRCVSTTVVLLIRLPKRKPNTLGSIIAQIKSVCTKCIWNMGYEDFAWQRRFHDRIIRNEYELRRKRAYIRNNPKNYHRH